MERPSKIIHQLICIFIIWFSAVVVVLSNDRLVAHNLTLTSEDRILVLAPHPDDEVLGCGGVIQSAMSMGLPVRVVFLTYGDNNQWSFSIYRKRPVLMPQSVRRMGLVRYDEALAADEILGLSSTNLTFLGYPDFGTLKIWYQHWSESPAYRGLLTRATSVPYKNALRPGAPYKGEEVLSDLTTVLREFRPTKVFVSHAADHNGDHRALYLFTRVALWDLAQEINPTIHPYLIHFKRWPRPRGYRPSEQFRPPSCFTGQIQWWMHTMTPSQIEKKYAAVKAHQSQYAYSRKYLSAFARTPELFGDYPSVILHSSVQNTNQHFLVDERKSELNLPEELTDEERAAYIGVENRTVRWEKDDLVISIAFSNPLARGVQASIYIFGYRTDLSFAKMPKLHVKLGESAIAIFDQKTRLNLKSISVTRQSRLITVRIPLIDLGRPQRILMSARTYLAEVPLDWTSWRTMELPSIEE